MFNVEYVKWRARAWRSHVHQLGYASTWRNYARRLGHRLGFYDAWLEYDLARGLGDWTWNPIPQWRRHADLVGLLKAAAADAQERGLDPIYLHKTKLPKRYYQDTIFPL